MNASSTIFVRMAVSASTLPARTNVSAPPSGRGTIVRSMLTSAPTAPVYTGQRAPMPMDLTRVSADQAGSGYTVNPTSTNAIHRTNAKMEPLV